MKTKLDLITKRCATEDRSFKFTSLAHVLSEEFMKDSFSMLKKNRGPGVDETTYGEYERCLSTKVQKLVKRMKE